MLLREIFCDKFVRNRGRKNETPRGRIIFDNGLNVVRGQSIGNNSVGKSSLLLAIDFAFGGESYIQDKYIIAMVGDHTINFCFVFDNTPYYFARNTDDSKTVVRCDKDYNKTGETMSISKFCSWLNKMYQISLKEISFRDIVGRYFRIYNKGNTDEKMPLAVVKSEAPEKSILALLKLYNHFTPIAQINKERDGLKHEKETLSKASKHDLIKLITRKKDHKDNLRKLEKLNIQLQQLRDTGLSEISDVDPTQMDMLASLQTRFDTLKKERQKLWSQYHAVKDVVDLRRPAKQQDFVELAKFFPNCDIKTISDIENFHIQIASLLNEEFENSKTLILSQVNALNRDIASVERDMKAVDLPQRITDETLNNFASVNRQIEDLESQNTLYLKKKDIDEKLKSIGTKYILLFMEQAKIMVEQINLTIAELNARIYGENTIKPRLVIEATNSYTLESVRDTGTATNYKNLILFDYTTLHITPLPALIHDTVIFNNIVQGTMTKLVDLYNKSQKQIFIAIDEVSKYSAETQAVLISKTRIELAKGGNELYGSDWSKLDNNTIGGQ